MEHRIQRREVNIQPAAIVQPGLSFDESIRTAQVIADAELTVMERAYLERYQQGVDNLLKTQNMEAAETLGSMAAGLALEERRRTLLSVAGKSLLFSLVGGGAVVAVGLPLVAIAPVAGVGVVLAVIVGRRG